MTTTLTLTFHQVGHAPEHLPVANLAVASRVLVKIQDRRGLGASDTSTGHGSVYNQQGKLVATVSYNGRVWVA